MRARGGENEREGEKLEVDHLVIEREKKKGMSQKREERTKTSRGEPSSLSRFVQCPPGRLEIDELYQAVGSNCFARHRKGPPARKKKKRKEGEQELVAFVRPSILQFSLNSPSSLSLFLGHSLFPPSSKKPGHV